MNRKTMAATLALAVWSGAATAGTYSWNAGSATWNDSSPNWSGDGTVWVDGSGNAAVFNNQSSATTITVDGARTAGAVKVGNGGNNAFYTFSNGAAGSLAAASFVVQGDGNNGPGAGPAVLDNLTLTTTGDLGIGRFMLVVKGASTVNVGGMITWNTAGVTSPDWGLLTIQDSAAVTAALGVDSYDHVWEINLNGGSLTTPVLRAIDGNWAFRNVHLTFNGGRLIASASNPDFLQINGNGQAWVNGGGAKIDTGANDVTILSKLIHDSSGPAADGGLDKSGTGTLTLSGVNSYNGDTTVTAGILATTASTALPSATDVSVASGAFMALNFSGTNTVNSLTLGGVAQRRGTWGAAGSGARFTSAQFTGTGVLLVVAGPVATYTWNTGAGAWDLAAANWTGEGSVWEDGNDAVFNNTGSATAVTLGGPRTAVAVKVGDGGNNANFTFSSNAGGSLSAESFLVQGSAGNGGDAGLSSPTVLNNLALSTAGNIGVGRWSLVIGGTSAVSAGGVIGGGGIAASPDWGTLTIQDSAVVTALGGVHGNAEAWSLNLNGGTLVAKSLQASDRESDGSARLTFNGTVVKPTQDSDNFVTVGANWQSTGSALVGNGGAVFDTDGKSIGVQINLKAAGSGGLTKRGAGTLTLSGPNNTYAGGTAVNGGTLCTPEPNAAGPGAVTVASGATWDLGPSSHTVAGLSGAGDVTRAGGGAVTTGADGASLISTNKNYLLLLDFGLNGDSTINGVTFTQAGTGGAGWSLAGATTPWNNEPGGTGYDQMMRSFYYGGPSAVLTLSNLTIGQLYNIVLYTRVGHWVGRLQNATFSNGTDTHQLPNTEPGNFGYYSYRFVATDPMATVTMVAVDGVNTFHWFGASLETVASANVLTIGDANDYTFSGVLSGDTALVKQGSGRQTLSGANTYGGATSVREGTLEITAADTLPEGTAVEIAAGATLRLSNAGEQTVSSLTFDGKPQYRGTWGSLASDAAHKRPQFAGTGVLRVLTGAKAPGMMLSLH